VPARATASGVAGCSVGAPPRLRKRHYPSLLPKWARTAALAVGPTRLSRVPHVMTPRTVALREARRLKKRRGSMDATSPRKLVQL